MRKRTLLFGGWLFALWAVSAVQAQVPAHPVDGAFVREWLLLGPFPSADLGTDFLAEVGGEEGVVPREGDAVVTAEGDTLIWRRHATRQDFVDLAEVFGDGEHVTAYAYCSLQSKIAGEAGLDLRSLNIDDSVEMWLNGEWLGLEVQEGANGCLLKIGHDSGRWGFAFRLYPPDRAVLAGAVTDAAGEPVAYADMRLEREGAVVAEWQTDYWGEYDEVNVYPADGAYDLSVTAGELGSWQLGLKLQPEDRQTLTHEVREAVSLAGTAWMLDGVTPHVAMPVQALKVGPKGVEAVATALSDKGGRYQFNNLKPGTYKVRCQLPGGYAYYVPDVPNSAHFPDVEQGAALTIEPGSQRWGIDFRVAPFKKGTWNIYNTLNGMYDDHAYVVYGDPNGVIWAGTRAGVARFDGTSFYDMDRPDDRKGTWVFAIEMGPDGALWIASEFGVRRYGETSSSFLAADSLKSAVDIAIAPDSTVWIAAADGAYRYGNPQGALERMEALAGVWVMAVYCAPDGAVWFGTDRGAYRYDGRAWDRLTVADGLAADWVTSIDRAPDGAMWFGTARGISRYHPGAGTMRTLTAADGLVHDFVNVIYVDGETVWVGTDRGVSRYYGQQCGEVDGPCAAGRFVNYTVADGLAADFVFDIHRDRQGHVWFAAERGGISRYDPETFVNFTAADGLLHDDVEAAMIEPDGTMWFGTGFATGSGYGVFRYDGREFVQFSTADGLAGNTVKAIERCPDGTIWFGTMGGGVSRYDGREFKTLTTADGLIGDFVESILCEDDGVWFGTGLVTGMDVGMEGVSHYDGTAFTNYTVEDGLVGGSIFAIHRTFDGAMWFGSNINSGLSPPNTSGASRFDGETFTNITRDNGLPSWGVHSIHQDEDGTIWLGASGDTNGLIRYDEEEFTLLSALTVHRDQESIGRRGSVLDFHRTADGILWAATQGGVIGYDGEAWTVLDTRDGMAHTDVWSVLEDANGYLWFTTIQGITRYRRSTTAPSVEIDFVRTDDWRQTALDAIPSVPTGTRITVGYRAIDFKTVPEKQQFRHRILELDADWRQPIRADRFEWTPAEAGTYTIEVQAIDRDLNYSEPASVTIVVTPQYGQIALWSSLGLSLIGLVLAGGYGLRRRRERDQIREQLVAELEREMQTAHELQMSLMPTEAPEVSGIQVAGQCVPATEVGGDIFQYFAEDGKFALALADVTGHGMQAAVPAMTFSGILNTEMKYGPALEALFKELNETLYASLDRRTFICFSMGEVDPATRVLRLANCGAPYPCHYRAATGETVELQMDGYPLGIRSGTEYEAMEVGLEFGDRIVFFSDGLVEAANEAGDFFGFERIVETIRQGCVEGLSAENLLQRIFGEVQVFSKAVAQEDDQTLIVLQVEGEAWSA